MFLFNEFRYLAPFLFSVIVTIAKEKQKLVLFLFFKQSECSLTATKVVTIDLLDLFFCRQFIGSFFFVGNLLDLLNSISDVEVVWRYKYS